MSGTRFGLFIILASLWIYSIGPSWSSNQWSLSFLQALLEPSASDNALSDAPAWHSRSELWMARLALATGRYGDVLAITLDRARAGDFLAGRLAGEAFLKMGQDADAAAVWASIGDIVSLLETSQSLQGDKKYDAAIKFSRAAFQVDPELSAISLAINLHMLRNPREAIARLNDVLASYDHSWLRSVWFEHLVILLRTQQEWESVQSMLDKWGDEFPIDYNRLIQQGLVLSEGIKDLDQAAKVFEEAIALKPGDGTAYWHLGNVLWMSDQYDEGATYYEQAVLLLAPTDQRALQAQGRLNASGN